MALEGAASAQAMFTASIGNVFGGHAPSTKRAWAIAIGGGGAHGIGSELEFSETRNFFETPAGVAHGKIITLMPSIFVAVPVVSCVPMAFLDSDSSGSERRHRAAEFFQISPMTMSGTASVAASPSSSRGRAGVRADLRHFKVRKSDGISFQRLMFGLVLGG